MQRTSLMQRHVFVNELYRLQMHLASWSWQQPQRRGSDNILPITVPTHRYRHCGNTSHKWRSRFLRSNDVRRFTGRSSIWSMLQCKRKKCICSRNTLVRQFYFSSSFAVFSSIFQLDFMQCAESILIKQNKWMNFALQKKLTKESDQLHNFSEKRY